MNFTLNEKKVYFFLILACLLAYANSLNGDFVFDDLDQIVNNPAIHSWHNIINAFTTDVWAFQRGTTDTVPPPYYRPIFTIFLTIGYKVFGLWQQGWHLLNLSIHIGATLLTFRLFRRLSNGRVSLSFVGSLFFALIPVHVESISWISGIPDPLAALFYIPSILFYIRWRESANKKFLVYSLIFFFCSILCKETPIVLPVILLLWELVLNNKKDGTSKFLQSVKNLLFFVIPIFVYFAFRFSVLGMISWKHPFNKQVSTEFILATIPYSVILYIKNIIFPYNLTLIYSTRFVEGLNDTLLWIPLTLLCLIGILFYVFRQKITPLMWMAVGLFFIPLLPVLNLQVFHFYFIVQDRYLYLPSIGFVLFIACLLEKLWESEKKNLQHIAIAAIALICIFYTFSTILQNNVWHSSVNLWTRVVKMQPLSWSHHYNLALAYYQNKDYDLAIQEFDTVIKYEALDPNKYQKTNLDFIYSNRGLAKKDNGDVIEAEKDFRKALEINPNQLEANVNLGAVLFERGDYNGAKTRFEKALEIKPSNTSASFNLARTLAKLNQHEEAINIFEKLLQNEKQDAELMYYAAISYNALGQKEKAMSLLNQSLELTKSDELKNQILSEQQAISKE